MVCNFYTGNFCIWNRNESAFSISLSFYSCYRLIVSIKIIYRYCYLRILFFFFLMSSIRNWFTRFLNCWNVSFFFLDITYNSCSNEFINIWINCIFKELLFIWSYCSWYSLHTPIHPCLCLRVCKTNSHLILFVLLICMVSSSISATNSLFGNQTRYNHSSSSSWNL